MPATVAALHEAIDEPENDRLRERLGQLEDRQVIYTAMILSKQTRGLIGAKGFAPKDPLANCARGAFMALNEVLRRLAPDHFASVINEVYPGDEEDDDDA